ncbi:hypothetical protein GGQ84_001596 [Desulfitispora alkaliphila]
MARAASSQFNSGKIEIKRVPYVKDEEHILDIIEEASTIPNCIIAYTLVIESMKQLLIDKCHEKNLEAIDVLGPMIKGLGKVTNTEPKMQPGLLHQLDDQYFRKVEAIEFAVKYDDGKDPRGMIYADIVFIGISRTSKTPLCMYLAHKRIKAANVPLVPEVSPPEELFKLPPKKVVGLTISPELLYGIRLERLKTLGLAASADYANMQRILDELEYAERIMKKVGCPIIDVTNRAVEETASKVLELYFKGDRHGE